MPETLVILDYGSQYTQLIARRTRELGVFSIIYDITSNPRHHRVGIVYLRPYF